MKIDRHNYEEFFMLYIDGELSHEERLTVEEFLEQNPDLKTEFELLQNTILPHHYIEFAEKQSLFKSDDDINLSNCQTYFLLYADNELSANNREKVEKFVLQHPDLQTDFTTLQQAKLQPEQIEFADKKVLFRTEKQRKTGAVIWFRLSVAAAIIGVLLFSATLFINNDLPKNNRELVKAKSVEKDPIKPLQNIPAPNSTSVAENITQNNPSNSITLTQSLTNKKIKTGIIKSSIIKETTALPILNNDATNATSQVAKVNRKERNLENNAMQNDNTNDKFLVQVSENKLISEKTETAVPNENIIQLPKQINTDYPIVQNAVYRELDVSEEENTMYIGSAAINKNKLKGLFKKVSRLIGKNSSESERF